MSGQNDAICSLREKFIRLIDRLGPANGKGTKRYQFEVDFCYAMREFEDSPPYLAGKMFERVADVCTSLDKFLKLVQRSETTVH